jgi:hypothetical protein
VFWGRGRTEPEHALIDFLHFRCNLSGKTKRSKEFGQSDGVRVTGDKLMCDQQLRHTIMDETTKI